MDGDFDFEIRAAAQATNATARAELYYSRSRDKRRTLQLGPNYATLIWHHPVLTLQATNTHISSLDEHAAAQRSWKVSKIGPAMA